MLVNLTVWAIIGIVAGCVANHFAPENGMGVMLNAIIGCIGALVGALALSLALPRHTSLGAFNLTSAGVALLTATIFLIIARLTVLHDGGRPSR